jgi:cation diffusion facilitator CzcD-associated flavoprotein CzcO
MRTHFFLLRPAGALLLLAIVVHAEVSHHDICVIGAGPAGIQLGQFLTEAKRSYVILERGKGSGTFFRKYPIHRKLNSFNRRYTRVTHPDFRLRQ